MHIADRRLDASLPSALGNLGCKDDDVYTTTVLDEQEQLASSHIDFLSGLKYGWERTSTDQITHDA
jgi:hypothetical protein